MISVIIPLMEFGHYRQCLQECKKSLGRQTAKLEIIVSEHAPQRFIEKNRLLNEGFEKAKGDIIWHCDADFALEDETVLERMENDLTDVIYPMFYSETLKKMKIADGGPMIRRGVLERHGKLDETAKGISLVTFPLLNWCIKNTDFVVRDDFVVTHNHYRSLKKIDFKTRSRLKKVYNQTNEMLNLQRH